MFPWIVFTALIWGNNGLFMATMLHDCSIHIYGDTLGEVSIDLFNNISLLDIGYFREMPCLLTCEMSYKPKKIIKTFTDLQPLGLHHICKNGNN